MKCKIKGRDVAALLHPIHTHALEIEARVKWARKEMKRRGSKEEECDDVMMSEIYYSEKELLPILKALGLPKPKWKLSMTIDQWKKYKKNKK